MDNLIPSEQETSVNSSIDKQVNKRRSAVFSRQSIIQTNQDLENTNAFEEVSQEFKKFKYQNENTKEPFNIEKYIESLKKEDKQWREVYAKRKSRVQDKNKVSKQKLDITSLSDSERAFLAGMPDYEEFNKNLFQLHAMATKVTFLNSCAKHFYEKSTSKIENDTKNATYRIINLTD